MDYFGFVLPARAEVLVFTRLIFDPDSPIVPLSRPTLSPAASPVPAPQLNSDSDSAYYSALSDDSTVIPRRRSRSAGRSTFPDPIPPRDPRLDDHLDIRQRTTPPPSENAGDRLDIG